MQGLGENLNTEVIRVSILAAELSAKGLKEIMLAVAKKIDEAPTVKSINYFAKSKATLDSIDIPGKHLNEFIAQCKKMNVQVAVSPDAADPKRINIIFRASQKTLIQKAITNYAFSPVKQGIVSKLANAIKKSAQTPIKPQTQDLTAVRSAGSR